MNKNIKIFVSHRIDKESATVNNPLFINVKCGAALANEIDENYLGDDTGDNISEKRKKFCELTVHYWAWKNQTAEYFGFCHYRRFLSFSDTQFEENEVGVVEYPVIDDGLLSTFNLNEKAMRSVIESNDIVIANYVPVGKYGSVRGYCDNNPNGYIQGGLDLLLTVVKEKSPHMEKYVSDFLNGDKNCWYNCFVMRNDIFQTYSEWLFDILFELEKRCDFSEYTQEQLRYCGLMAERLLGAYIEFLKDQNKYKIQHRQLVWIANTKKNPYPKSMIEESNIVALPGSDIDVPLLAVTLTSLVKSTTEPLNIFILSDTISDVNLEKLRLICSLSNKTKISIIETSLYIDKYLKENPNLSRFEANKFTIFDVFHSSNKVLLISPGIVCENHKLKDVFCYELEDSIFAATYNYSDAFTNKDRNIFDCSLALFNCNAVSSKYSVNSLIDTLFLLNKSRFSFTDVMNYRFSSSAKKLPAKFNAGLKFDSDVIRLSAPNYIYEDFENSLRNRVFTNYLKYWPLNLQLSDDFTSFWLNAKESFFYEKLLANCLFAHQNKPTTYSIRKKHSLVPKILRPLLAKIKHSK